MSKTAVYALNSGTVVDLSVVKTFNVEELTDFLKDDTVCDPGRAFKADVILLVVEKASEFFNSGNMVALIEAGDSKYKLIAEQAGIVLTTNEVDTIRRAKMLRAEIMTKIAQSVPPYPFYELPDGWEVSTKLVINGNIVRRKAGLSTYSAGLKTLQRLWLTFSPGWASGIHIASSYFVIYGGDRKVEMTKTGIIVGCQTIERYELEQLALHQGWKFPEATAK